MEEEEAVGVGHFRIPFPKSPVLSVCPGLDVAEALLF